MKDNEHTRILKVSSSRRAPDKWGRGSYSTSPAINLKGKWLAELGFNTGDQVSVSVSNNQIIIRAQSLERK